jgi:hypothetical protein
MVIVPAQVAFDPRLSKSILPASPFWVTFPSDPDSFSSLFQRSNFPGVLSQFPFLDLIVELFLPISLNVSFHARNQVSITQTVRSNGTCAHT